MPLVPNFAPDYTPAIVVPANADNVYFPKDHAGIPNSPRAWVLHTPEERADNVEVTPTWFQQYHPDQRGSTHYYLDNDGDVYQCVPETWGAIANGFNPGPAGLTYPFWAGPFSLNWQTVSVEIEGYAASIGQTLNEVQFRSLVRLIKHRAAAWKIPLTRDYIIGHYQVAWDRTDPGATFPWGKLMAALGPEEDDLKPLMAWDLGRQRWYFVGPAGAKWVTQDATVQELKRQFGPLEEKALSTAAIEALGG